MSKEPEPIRAPQGTDGYPNPIPRRFRQPRDIFELHEQVSRSMFGLPGQKPPESPSTKTAKLESTQPLRRNS